MYRGRRAEQHCRNPNSLYARALASLWPKNGSPHLPSYALLQLRGLRTLSPGPKGGSSPKDGLNLRVDLCHPTFGKYQRPP